MIWASTNIYAFQGSAFLDTAQVGCCTLLKYTI